MSTNKSSLHRCCHPSHTRFSPDQSVTVSLLVEIERNRVWSNWHTYPSNNEMNTRTLVDHIAWPLPNMNENLFSTCSSTCSEIPWMKKKHNIRKTNCLGNHGERSKNSSVPYRTVPCRASMDDHWPSSLIHRSLYRRWSRSRRHLIHSRGWVDRACVWLV